MKRKARIVLGTKNRKRYTGTSFKVGDVVRLTGADWGGYGHGDVVARITEIDPDSGTVTVVDGSKFYIFRSDWMDFSATLIRRASR